MVYVYGVLPKTYHAYRYAGRNFCMLRPWVEAGLNSSVPRKPVVKPLHVDIVVGSSPSFEPATRRTAQPAPPVAGQFAPPVEMH